jgi:tRNA pseudouridine38-40 synthase
MINSRCLETLHRFKLTLEYDGTAFSGWQRQDNAVSVQEAVEKAITAFTGLPTTIFVAGRTDAGVHATGQVAHVDVPSRFDARTVFRATNVHLRPHLISVLKVEPVPSTFHARFDAIKRHYTYRIVNRRSPLALEYLRAWHYHRPLDSEAMRQGATHLLGHHDFTTFRTVHCQSKSPLKTLDHIAIETEGESIFLHFSAPSFLHHQVRNMVGSLVLVGVGQWSPDRIKEVLEAKDRSQGGPTAPACEDNCAKYW